MDILLGCQRFVPNSVGFEVRWSQDRPIVVHSSGNSSPTRSMSFAQAIRDVSCERGF